MLQLLEAPPKFLPDQVDLIGGIIFIFLETYFLLVSRLECGKCTDLKLTRDLVPKALKAPFRGKGEIS